MTHCPLLVSSALVLVAGTVAWTLTGLPGGPAACLPAGCDCEAAGPGPIRQPANAWSSLALTAAGTVALAVSRSPTGEVPTGTARRRDRRQARALRRLAPTRRLAGAASVLAGLAAFLYHASLTAWAARLDGIGVAVLAGALALHGWARLSLLFDAGGEGEIRRSIVPGALLAVGGLCWWLGRSSATWCRPDSVLPAHAAWHLLAAAAVGLWLAAGRREGHSPSPTSPGL